MGILIFKRLTARRLYRSFGVIGLIRERCVSPSFDGARSSPTIIRQFLEWYTFYGGSGDNPLGDWGHWHSAGGC
jgi:hypothetical protein